MIIIIIIIIFIINIIIIINNIVMIIIIIIIIHKELFVQSCVVTHLMTINKSSQTQTCSDYRKLTSPERFSHFLKRTIQSNLELNF